MAEAQDGLINMEDELEDSRIKKAKVGKGSRAEFDCSDTNLHSGWRTIDFEMEKGSEYKVSDNCKGW